tara:strand:+ start:271 stop:783 length:513 start_codon:yes stop_codon:yes gene_type:complete
MKLARISIGQKGKIKESYAPPGIREKLMIDSGRYTIGIEYPLKRDKEVKDKKVINDATYFVVYWCKTCVYKEKQQKFIGIYENKGLLTIDSEEQYRMNYLGMDNIMSPEKFERIYRHQYITGQRKGYGANLNKIYDGVLNFPENVHVTGDFGNIKNEKNIEYIQDILLTL